MKPKYKAVIFDLDGTLLHTLDDLANSVNFALRTHSIPQREREEIRNFLGNGIRNLMRSAAGIRIAADENKFEALFQTFRAHYEKHCRILTQPFEGIIPLLTILKNNGVRMAIVSNKVDSAVQDLSRHFFANLIDVAVGESDTVRRKPNPDAVLQAIDRLGCNPNETIYVGDSEVDFETAQNAKIAYSIVLWGYRDKDFLQQKGIIDFANDVDELRHKILGD